MRIRTIKPEFFVHEALFELEKSSKLPIRIAFAGLWCAADREGRFKWEPRRLGVQILPYDNLDFSRVLDALTTRDFIRRYQVSSVLYGYIPSFLKHQIINNRERPSELPEYVDGEHIDASSTRDSRDEHADTEERKGKEGKGTRKARASRDELIAYALSVGMKALDGEFVFEQWETNGWKNGTNPVVDWKAGFRTRKLSGWLPSQKAGFIAPEDEIEILTAEPELDLMAMWRQTQAEREAKENGA